MARGPGDTLVSLIVDAADQAGLTVERRDLVATDASSTVTLTFARVGLAAERCVSSVPFDPTAHAAGAVLRLNGSLALGLAAASARLTRRVPAATSGGPHDVMRASGMLAGHRPFR